MLDYILKWVKRKFCNDEKAIYRHGTCYKLFVGRIYCIQKEDWLGNFYNVFETQSEIVYKKKVLEMIKSGVKFKQNNYETFI
jgi:hypothetical protein